MKFEIISSNEQQNRAAERNMETSDRGFFFPQRNVKQKG